MTLYTRPQLSVLLLVVVTAGIGLGVGQWRRTYPESADRVERFDRAAVPMKPTVDDLPVAHAGRRSAPPTVTAAAPPLDINRASEDELRALPGIGSVLASRIVEARVRDGPFTSVDDLRRVRGLGRAKLEKLTAAIALRP